MGRETEKVFQYNKDVKNDICFTFIFCVAKLTLVGCAGGEKIAESCS